MPEHVVARAARLLGQGMAVKQVAQLLGISTDSVSKIKHGRHAGGRAKLARCPGCGGLVEPPCLLCGVRSQPSEFAGVVGEAPYLAEAYQLSDELAALAEEGEYRRLTVSELLKLRRAVKFCQASVRAAREAWEDQAGLSGLSAAAGPQKPAA